MKASLTTSSGGSPRPRTRWKADGPKWSQMFKLTVVDHLRPCEHYCTRWGTTIAPFESLGKKFRKTYLSNKSQSLNQVEGGWDEDGKGLSNWDKWTEDPSHTTDGSSGKVFFSLRNNLSRMERCQRTATTSTRRMCSSQLTWELASIACPSRGPVSSLRVSELSVLRWVSKRFPDGTAKPVGGNVFVEICNFSHIYNHFHSCVGKKRWYWSYQIIVCPSLLSL